MKKPPPLALPYEQTYNLWILDTQYTEQFYKQIKILTEDQRKKEGKKTETE